jgi:hypothetical protein
MAPRAIVGPQATGRFTLERLGEHHGCTLSPEDPQDLTVNGSIGAPQGSGERRYRGEVIRGHLAGTLRGLPTVGLASWQRHPGQRSLVSAL